MQRRAVRVVGSDAVLAARAGIARSALERAIGFMFATRIDPDDARFFEGYTALHTFFVFTPLDIVFLDEQLRVTELRERVAPFTPAVVARGGRSALELAPGRIESAHLRVGDQLQFV